MKMKYNKIVLERTRSQALLFFFFGQISPFHWEPETGGCVCDLVNKE